MKQIVLNEKEIYFIKFGIKLLICCIIALNINNYNLVMLLFMIMAFI